MKELPWSQSEFNSNLNGRYREVAKKKLKKGPMKGKQRGSAVKVKSHMTTTRAGKRIRIKAYKRGKPGGKRG